MAAEKMAEGKNDRGKKGLCKKLPKKKIVDEKKSRRIKRNLLFTPDCFFFVLNTQINMLRNERGFRGPKAPWGGGGACSRQMRHS